MHVPSCSTIQAAPPLLERLSPSWQRLDYVGQAGRWSWRLRRQGSYGACRGDDRVVSRDVSRRIDAVEVELNIPRHSQAIAAGGRNVLAKAGGAWVRDCHYTTIITTAQRQTTAAHPQLSLSLSGTIQHGRTTPAAPTMGPRPEHTANHQAKDEHRRPTRLHGVPHSQGPRSCVKAVRAQTAHA